jgi:hypothetical protein
VRLRGLLIFVRERFTTPNFNNKQLQQMSQQIEKREEKLFGTKQNNNKKNKEATQRGSIYGC